jgi:hypothetical protein
MKRFILLLVVINFILAVSAFAQMQNFDEKVETKDGKKVDPKLMYFQEKFEEVFTDYYFDEVWNAIISSIESTGCQIAQKSSAQDDDGLYKGKIVSDFCIFAMKENKDKVIDSLIKYSYEVPLIRAGVWENGRIQYKIVLKEKEDSVEMTLKGEISGREGYVTNEVHWWKSSGWFEHHLILKIKENLEKGQ